MAKKRSLEEGGYNERAQNLLKVLVERYIREGEPVGSRTLARDSGMDLSPATIRNIMADLEDLGLVSSPHTSAGRIPTVSGYRLFVDSLLTVQPLETRTVKELQSQLKPGSEQGLIVQSASKMLSGLTQMAGVVMIPTREQVIFRQIEFLPLSANRVLTILITKDGEVHNRIIQTRKKFTESELEHAANLLNRSHAGSGLEEMYRQLVQEMEKARDDMNRIMSSALEIAEQMITPEADHDFVMDGQTNLMNFNEFNQMDRLRDLFNSFNEKHELVHLLDVSMKAEGVQIFIGEESGYKPMDHCSLVTAPYEADDRVAGVLGVIGPTRMAYDKVIPIVDITAKLMSAALKQS